MVGLIIVLLLIWVVLAIIGFTIKGLFWLAIVATVLIVVTVTLGWAGRRGNIRS